MCVSVRACTHAHVRVHYLMKSLMHPLLPARRPLVPVLVQKWMLLILASLCGSMNVFEGKKQSKRERQREVEGETRDKRQRKEEGGCQSESLARSLIPLFNITYKVNTPKGPRVLSSSRNLNV